ncbi:MAG TPA: hypothetical protein VKY74_20655 [Chloroflexia bacterium]|nr:hypothetical protein [Chloroflexia bacterium]
MPERLVYLSAVAAALAAAAEVERQTGVATAPVLLQLAAHWVPGYQQGDTPEPEHYTLDGREQDPHGAFVTLPPLQLYQRTTAMQLAQRWLDARLRTPQGMPPTLELFDDSHSQAPYDPGLAQKIADLLNSLDTAWRQRPVPYPVQWLGVGEAAWGGLQVDPPTYSLRRLLIVAEDVARRSSDPLNCVAWDHFPGVWEIFQALRAALRATIAWRVGWPTQVAHALAEAAEYRAAALAPSGLEPGTPGQTLAGAWLDPTSGDWWAGAEVEDGAVPLHAVWIPADLINRWRAGEYTREEVIRQARERKNQGRLVAGQPWPL